MTVNKTDKPDRKTSSIEPDTVYTLDEARTLLRIGRNLMRQLINSGELRAKKVGKRRYRVLGSELLRYLGAMGHNDYETESVTDRTSSTEKEIDNQEI